MGVITCPSCSSPNSADAKFCTHCGAALRTVQPRTKAKPVRQPPEVIRKASVPDEVAAGKRKAGNKKGSKPKPAEPGAENSAKPAKPPRVATVILPRASVIKPSSPEAKETVLVDRVLAKLVFENGAEVKLSGGLRFDIGRKDLANDWDPVVDLTPFGGEQGGASRVHGFIAFINQEVQIQDVGSLNKTFVNGVELVPNRPYTLENGDEIVFGAVPARFILEE